MNAIRCAVVVLAAGMAGAAHGQQIVDLGLLPGTTRAAAYGVSADGLVAVGSVSPEYPEPGRAFRWTAVGGMQDLGLPPGATAAAASGASADGSVVAGTCGPVNGRQVTFRWTSAGGMQDLTSSLGMNAYGAAISSGGQVVAGSYIPTEGLAFRWTAAEGPQLLGVLFNDSNALGVSGDGSVVVGVSGMWSRAFRWTAAGGMQDLVPGGLNGMAEGANADGSVIVGVMFDGGAFRWTQAAGAVALPVPPGFDSAGAHAISADSSTIVGHAVYDVWSSPMRALLWRDGRSMRLESYLAMAGVDVAGWMLEVARGVSGNGRVIVGSGEHNGQPRAFLADLGPNPPPMCYANCDASTAPPMLNIADFSCFLNRFAAGSPYANCDNSIAAPTLNIQDFQCFLNQFVAGCS